MTQQVRLSYLFKTFLKIGAVSWGGHLSLVSMARQKMVDQDKVLSDQLVVESLSLASILPGPVAVNIVSYWGYKLRGWKGAVISAFAVLLPAFVAICVLSYFYFKYAHLVAFKAFFKGIMPAVAAIIFSTGISMSKKNKMDFFQWILLLLAIFFFAYIKGYWTSLFTIIGGAILGFIVYQKQMAKSENITKSHSNKSLLILLLGSIIFAIVIFAFSPPIEKALESQFAFISLSQIGGGYVVIPSMEKVFVDSLHWLTHQEFVDGIALSQITPGPIFIIATFVGFKMDKILGSLAATIAVYFPSALLMILTGSLYGRVQNLYWIKAAFKGIQPVVIGMIFSAAIGILLQHPSPWMDILLFLVGLFLIIRFNIPTVAILLGMGIIGIVIF